MVQDQAGNLRKMVSESGNKKITNTCKNAKVITVTGGKGGSGKSNFSANVAIALARQNKKVVIIDADLGLANIEILFGIIPKKNLLNLLNGENKIEDILVEGPLGIKFISGGSGLSELAELDRNGQMKIINAFIYLDNMFDYIIIDTGAGISSTVLNFIYASDSAIIVTTSEPTAITDAYSLLKIIKESNEKNLDISVVVNKTENNKEGKKSFDKLQLVTNKFLELDLKNLGYIHYDNNLVKAVKQQVPISILNPTSTYSLCIESIANNIISSSTNINNEDNSVGAKRFLAKLLKFIDK